MASQRSEGRGFDGGETCWSLILGAAAGEESKREVFSKRYLPVVRSYLTARWRHPPYRDEVEDAAQEVFVELFKEGGALPKASPGGGQGGFRAFLYAVVRNVAKRIEERLNRNPVAHLGVSSGFENLQADETRLSLAFDREWMRSLLGQAVGLQKERAATGGDRALRRVELLKLRFNDNLPIREIAHRWEVPAVQLHREYAQARKEFMVSLRDVIAHHNPDDPKALEREIARFGEYLQ